MNTFAVLFSLVASTFTGPQTLNTVTPQDLINWKVGDEANFIVSGGSFGKLGNLHKFVAKEEDGTLWITQDVQMMNQREKVEMQIRKADAVVLKVIRNGKEEKLPDNDFTSEKQEYTQITVPAGKFKCIHIVGSTKDVKHLQIWANPKEVSMEGTLKQIVPTQMLEVTMELESFKKQ